MAKKLLYRVKYLQDEQICELYARYISEDSLIGFVELEGIVFAKQPQQLIVDPEAEKLAAEFAGVQRCYLPMHTILRIDEVDQSIWRDANTTSANDNIRHLAKTAATEKRENE